MPYTRLSTILLSLSILDASCLKVCPSLKALPFNPVTIVDNSRKGHASEAGSHT